jgi:HEAT repeat protein
MRRRRWLGGLVLVLVVAAAALLYSTSVLTGLLRGEQFYRWRPTSYWSQQIRDADSGRPPSWAERAASRLGIPAGPDLSVLSGDPAAVPVLAELVGDEDHYVRLWGAMTLNQLGPQAAAAVPALVRALERGDDGGNYSLVCGTLARMAGQVPEADRAVERALGNDDQSLRLTASLAVGIAGQDGAPVLPLLRRALRHERWQVRSGAADALGDMGAAAEPAVPDLKEALRDERIDVQVSARVSLSLIEQCSTNRAAADH